MNENHSLVQKPDSITFTVGQVRVFAKVSCKNIQLTVGLAKLFHKNLDHAHKTVAINERNYFKLLYSTIGVANNRGFEG